MVNKCNHQIYITMFDSSVFNNHFYNFKLPETINIKIEIPMQSVGIGCLNSYLVVYQFQKADIFRIVQNDFHDKNDVFIL